MLLVFNQVNIMTRFDLSLARAFNFSNDASRHRRHLVASSLGIRFDSIRLDSMKRKKKRKSERKSKRKSERERKRGRKRKSERKSERERKREKEKKEERKREKTLTIRASSTCGPRRRRGRWVPDSRRPRSVARSMVEPRRTGVAGERGRVSCCCV